MFKETIFAASTQAGPGLSIYDPCSAMEKTASIKMAFYSPELKVFLATLKTNPDWAYVVSNAMTAGESWSCNENGDFFSRKDLRNKHHTFVGSAFVYRDHHNKPGSGHPRFGRPVFSQFNDRMDRVELVLKIAKHDIEEGGIKFSSGQDILARIERGDLLPVSMGTKVKFDVCSYCGHRSKTVKEYCDHLHPDRMGLMGKYLNGIRVYAINPDPDFFDISIVVVGAEKTSFTFEKVARRVTEAQITPSVVLGDRLQKEAADLDLYQIARALAGGLDNLLGGSEGGSRDMSFAEESSVLDGSGGLSGALAGLLGAGVVARPHEFASMVLRGADMEGASREVLDAKIVPLCEDQIEVGNISLLADPHMGVVPDDLVAERSCKPGSSMLRARVHVLLTKKATPRRPYVFVKKSSLAGSGNPILKAIAATVGPIATKYHAYLLEAVPQAVNIGLNEITAAMMLGVLGATAKDVLVTEHGSKTFVANPGSLVIQPEAGPPPINFNSNPEYIAELSRIIDGRMQGPGLENPSPGNAKVAGLCQAVVGCFAPLAEVRGYVSPDFYETLKLATLKKIARAKPPALALVARLCRG